MRQLYTGIDLHSNNSYLGICGGDKKIRLFFIRNYFPVATPVATNPFQYTFGF
jgi:hypothetical protein